MKFAKPTNLQSKAICLTLSLVPTRISSQPGVALMWSARRNAYKKFKTLTAPHFLLRVKPLKKGNPTS